MYRPCLFVICAVLLLLLVGGMPFSVASGPSSASELIRVDTTETAEERAPEADTTEADTTEAEQPSQEPVDAPDMVGATPDAPSPSGEEGDLDAPVELTARDSLILSFRDDAEDTGTLHGEAQAVYESNTLQAQTITYFFGRDEMHASGPPSDTAASPHPVFDRGDGDEFTGAELAFNLRSQRGRVVQARTSEGDGLIEGGVIKRFEEGTSFIADGIYTTDRRPPGVTPSYSLRSTQMKVVDERWVYTGPIQLYIFNIPTPFWLPFGMLPYTEERRSGPLPPTYGEDDRGFYLRDFGWYFAMNEFTDLTIEGGVWSGGSFEINPRFRYNRRYHYDGDLRLRLLFERFGQPEDPDFRQQRDGRLQWSHNQDLTPTSSLRGSVDLATSSDFTRSNTTNYNEAVRQEVSSNLRYRQQWPGSGRNLTVNASQRQQLESGDVRITLPDISFRQRNFKPFERDRVGTDEAWYERITTSYRGSLSNSFVYNPTEETDIEWYEAMFSPSAYREGHRDENRTDPFDIEASHSIPVNASFRINEYNLSITPRFDYSSDWVIRTQRKQLVVDSLETDEDDLEAGVGTPVETRVDTRSEAGFAARHDFSTGVSLSTEFFGLFQGQIGPFRGLRHRVQPSISYSYQPDFNDPRWGRTRTYISDLDGTEQRYDIFTGRDVQGSVEQQSLSFSVNNQFETKRVRVDSTGATEENTIQLLRLNASSSYNIAADSLKLSDINMNARTTVSDFRINLRTTFSPYQFVRIEDNGTERFELVDRYMVSSNPLTPVRLTNFRASLSGDFSMGRGGQGPPRRGMQGRQTGQRSQPGSTRGAPGDEASGSIPWSLDWDFSYRYRRQFVESTQRAEVNGNFTVGLTPKWSVSGRTGYDIVEREIASTQLSVYRDLGAWEMSFSWAPFGQFQSYSFSLNVKSGQLRNLLRLDVPRDESQGRLGGAGSLLDGGRGGSRGGAPF